MIIYKQISLVMNEVVAIGKNKTNIQQGYKFRSIDTIYNMIHPLFSKHGVFTVPEVLTSVRSEKPTKAGGLMTYTVATIKFNFYAEDGSSVSAIVIGEGSDSGDKSSNKAMAAAHKYALLQVLCIPFEDIKDADETSHEIAAAETKEVW